jgi:hypothetical protein
MGTHVIGQAKIAFRMPRSCLIEKVRDVLRNMRSRLHEERNDHDFFRTSLDTIVQSSVRRWLSVLQKSVFYNILDTAHLHRSRDSFNCSIIPDASAPVAHNDDRRLHAISARRVRRKFLA